MSINLPPHTVEKQTLWCCVFKVIHFMYLNMLICRGIYLIFPEELMDTYATNIYLALSVYVTYKLSVTNDLLYKTMWAMGAVRLNQLEKLVGRGRIPVILSFIPTTYFLWINPVPYWIMVLMYIPMIVLPAFMMVHVFKQISRITLVTFEELRIAYHHRLKQVKENDRQYKEERGKFESTKTEVGNDVIIDTTDGTSTAYFKA